MESLKSIKRVICIGPMGLDVITVGARSARIGQTSQEAMITVCPGGACRNVAENLARLGVPVSLLSMQVKGGLGAFLLSETESTGVTIIIHEGQEIDVSTYCGWIDKYGEVLNDAADYREVEKAFGANYLSQHKDQVLKQSLVIANSDVSAELLHQLVLLSEEKEFGLCFLPGGLEGCERLREWIDSATVVVLSVQEAEALLETRIARIEDALDCCLGLISAGKTLVAVVTMGKNGAVFASLEGEAGHLECPDVTGEVVSVVGGGDAFTAGTICGLYHGWLAAEAVRMGLAAAAITVRTTRTCAEKLTFDECRSIASGMHGDRGYGNCNDK